MDLEFLPRLKRCCCCLPLRVGCLLIGYASLFGSMLSMGMVSWSLYLVVKFVAESAERPDPEHPPSQIARDAVSLYISHAYFYLVLLYYFVISLLLVIGVHRNKSGYLRYYFYTALVLLVLAITMVVVTCVFFGILATIPLLKWCVILFYCLLVVRSAYLEIEEQQKPRVYEMQNLYSPPPQQFYA